MFGLEERKKRTELLIEILAKLHVLVGLSGQPCPLCRMSSVHDPECPLSLAWSLIDTGRQAEVERNIRAYALSMELDREGADTLVH
jgi:hypothetical protein